ncbi:MAG: bifunctional tRNA (adenosine(37)-N6)-threonylcarbamoyltransferase complex ATPase subunit type 1 TsaE/phosphotransferase, partial [Beijerinckiaceae bacterium]
YSRLRRAQDPAFDPLAFSNAYATMAAQRATKILGIFTRLNKRDGKPAYLRHIPRVERYLLRNLAHPALAGVKAWYERVLPGLFTAKVD